MEDRRFLGRYNSIYFLSTDDRISEICDRRSRKRSVPFREAAPMDLSGANREPGRMSTEGEMPSEKNDTITILDKQYIRAGRSMVRMAAGFGRHLRYQEVIAEHRGVSVLLTVTLPAQCRYDIAWRARSNGDNTFDLEECIRLTVFTNLPWTYQNDVFTAISGSEEGEVTFLIESLPKPIGILLTAIVCCIGLERQAILARAACGQGFVSCFAVDPSDQGEIDKVAATLEAMEPTSAILIGNMPDCAPKKTRVLRFTNTLANSNDVAQALGEPNAVMTLEAPAQTCAAGPALYLAFENNAALRFVGHNDADLVLVDERGASVNRWRIADLLGIPLGPSQAAELVVCESTWDDLLVCQGLGYSQLRSAPIAFIEPIAQAQSASLSFDGASAMCRAAVPASLRAPDATTVIVFTAWMPLHLTQFDTVEPTYWFDRYAIAHLPGQLASTLVPRALLGLAALRPAISLGVIFDALVGWEKTEGRAYVEQLQGRMNHPVHLTDRAASKDVLRELLEMFDSDLIVLITHGRDDYIQDSVNDRIHALEIRGWKLRGTPIVFNNSCSSWPTTGPAFLQAGAVGYVGTLWPVTNECATTIASCIASDLRGNEAPDMASILSSAQRTARSQNGLMHPDRGAYMYVGLPGPVFLNIAPINKTESLLVTSALGNAVYEAVGRLVVERGRPDIAVLIHGAVVPALEARIRSHVVPGELPPQLPPFPGTVIDAGYFLALCNYGFGAAVLTRLAHEHQPPIIEQMNAFLLAALKELVEWDERHDAHMGTSPERRASLSSQFGMPIGHDGGELGFYRRSAKYVVDFALPFAALLCENQEFEKARFWFDLSSKMVTTREDVSPDGSVCDEVLIRRLREGLLVEHRVLKEGGTLGQTVSTDILANSASKSELANRFGIVLKRLNQNDRAVPFFQAARDLASPGSEESANATANLASVLGGRREQHTLYHQALDRQVSAGDYRNAIVTTANILRSADSPTRVSGRQLLDRALSWLPLLATPTERAHARSDLLGAAAVFFASSGQHAEVSKSIADLGDLLKHSFPERSVAVHLNEVLDYYVRREAYELAAGQGFSNGQLLEQVDLPDVAMKTYLIAADCAARAAKGKNRRLFSLFLECSRRLGRLMPRQPATGASLLKEITLTRENTESLWRQFASRGETRMAFAAYSALKAWQTQPDLREWEELGHALHPRNHDAVIALSSAGFLRREAVVELQSDGDTRVTVTTVRQDRRSGSLGPTVPERVVLCWPLHKDSRSVLPLGSSVAAKTVLFQLGWNEYHTVSETTHQGVRTDGQGTFVYEEMWGSRIIPYFVTWLAPSDMIPIDVDVKMVAGAPPEIVVTCIEGRISVSLQQGASPLWLGTVRILLRVNGEVPLAIETARESLSEPIPFDLYRATMRLFAPGLIGGLPVREANQYPSLGPADRIATERLLKRLGGTPSFSPRLESCRQILFQVVIAIHEDGLLWPDTEYEAKLESASSENYRSQLLASAGMMQLFGQALYANFAFRDGVRKEEELVNLFLHAASRLVHEVLPSKDLSVKAIPDILLPLARSAMLLRSSEDELRRSYER